MIPTFVDYVVLRVGELDTTERFFTAVLGPPRRAGDSLMYQLGDARLFSTPCHHHSQEPYDKEKVGLNHVAFGVRTLEELHAIHARLKNHGISNSGIIVDSYGNKEFIWLDDPDGMRIEFYFATLVMTRAVAQLT